MNAVDNNLMRENDPRMPISNERKSKVTFGASGKKRLIFDCVIGEQEWQIKDAPF